MNTEELNALKERAYKTAVEHGFHEEEKSDAYWLGLVMSEMGEAVNADRKGLHADTKKFEVDLAIFPFDFSFEKQIKDSVEDEIADIVIRLLDFAGLKGYELRYKNNITQSDIEFLGLGEGFVADLFYLVGGLIEALENDGLEMYICGLFSIFSGCFDEMTGSDCDLWWFVKQKMRYNELRPKLNGKLY